MNPPTHSETAQRARELWLANGKPVGCDHAIWLEAERQLRDESHSTPPARDGLLVDARQSSTATTSARLQAETAAESVVEYHLSPAPSDEAAVKAALQKTTAKRPRSPK